MEEAANISEATDLLMVKQLSLGEVI